MFGFGFQYKMVPHIHGMLLRIGIFLKKETQILNLHYITTSDEPIIDYNKKLVDFGKLMIEWLQISGLQLIGSSKVMYYVNIWL